MKVLMVNRPERNWIGGDSIKLNKVTQELNNIGVETDILELEKLTMDEWYGVEQYDIIHTWNFSMLWSKYAVWLAGKKKKKTVATMVYYDTEAFIPYPFQQIMMDHLDAAIYETEGEIDRAKKHLKVKNSHIVGNGLDSWWFDKDDTKIPFKDYVLTVGRIEPNKGQLEAAMACKELNLRYICIGQQVDPEYAKLCAKAGAIMLPGMSQEKLKPYYASCICYCQPSQSETWGMAVDEAGSQACPLVLSTGFERLDVPDAVYSQHRNPVAIREAINFAIGQGNNYKFQEILKGRTWKHVAEQYKEIYESILEAEKGSGDDTALHEPQA